MAADTDRHVVEFPLWDGQDTGFASWRTVIFSRWPVSGLPPCFEDAADYNRRVQRLQDAGLIVDTGQVYWQARLSPRFPTIEVRCSDVQLTADEAIMLAGIIRALVETALRRPPPGRRRSLMNPNFSGPRCGMQPATASATPWSASAARFSPPLP